MREKVWKGGQDKRRGKNLRRIKVGRRGKDRMIGMEGRRAKGCEERESIEGEKRCEEKKIMGERKGRNEK